MRCIHVYSCTCIQSCIHTVWVCRYKKCRHMAHLRQQATTIQVNWSTKHKFSRCREKHKPVKSSTASLYTTPAVINKFIAYCVYNETSHRQDISHPPPIRNQPPLARSDIGLMKKRGSQANYAVRTTEAVYLRLTCSAHFRHSS